MNSARTLSVSLVSHTNVGKTTLARTLLSRDIGEVHDAAHVTDTTDAHELMRSAQGDVLQLWDTPGFGDSARLVRRMQLDGHPLGWLLSQVWDRWRDRAFWSSQQALHHVRERSDLVLYLVNAGEPEAGYLAPEMQLLQWLGKPVLVLLNQLGPPREPAAEAAELLAWRERLASHTLVREVLPLDAFARCWVQEAALWRAVQRALPPALASAMQRLLVAWSAAREAAFSEAMQILASSLARTAQAREPLPPAGPFSERVLGAVRAIKMTVGNDSTASPMSAAMAVLATAAQAEVRSSTQHLLALYGQRGQAALAEGLINERVASQMVRNAHLDEGKAALWGGVLSGALLGLKADVLSGGLTLGGGLLTGGVLGALGAAGAARGANLVRGAAHSTVGWKDEALTPMVHAALLRYLAVAHFGRGRGDWLEGEAPPFWQGVVQDALAPEAQALAALWQARSAKLDNADQATLRVMALAAALTPIVTRATRRALASLYPTLTPHPTDKAP